MSLKGLRRQRIGMNRHRINFLLHEWPKAFRVDGQLFEFIESCEAVYDSPEDGVFEIECWLCRVGDEELALIGIDAGIRHRQEASFAVL